VFGKLSLILYEMFSHSVTREENGKGIKQDLKDFVKENGRYG